MVDDESLIGLRILALGVWCFGLTILPPFPSLLATHAPHNFGIRLRWTYNWCFSSPS